LGQVEKEKKEKMLAPTIRGGVGGFTEGTLRTHSGRGKRQGTRGGGRRFKVGAGGREEGKWVS